MHFCMDELMMIIAAVPVLGYFCNYCRTKLNRKRKK